MNTSEILMTDPTTEDGRRYWEDRRRLEEWREAQADEQRDDEPIYELRRGLKRCAHRMRYTGHQCQLADGHVGRHAWEPSWVERVAAIESANDRADSRTEKKR